MMDVELQIILF